MTGQTVQIETLVQELELSKDDAYIAPVLAALSQQHPVICVRSTIGEEQVRRALHILTEDLGHQDVDLVIAPLNIFSEFPIIRVLAFGTVHRASIVLLINELFEKVVKSAGQRLNVSLFHADGQSATKFDLQSQQRECLAHFNTA